MVDLRSLRIFLVDLVIVVVVVCSVVWVLRGGEEVAVNKLFCTEDAPVNICFILSGVVYIPHDRTVNFGSYSYTLWTDRDWVRLVEFGRVRNYSIPNAPVKVGATPY